jgi:DNA-binding SARP family transcriptional activator
VKRALRALEHGDLHVVAPAGYGKSSLLRGLISYLPGSTLIALSHEDADLEQLTAKLNTLPPDARIVVLDDAQHLRDAPAALNWLAARRTASRARWIIGGREVPAVLLDASHAADTLRMSDLAFGPNETRALLDATGHDDAYVAEWHQRVQGWPLALALLAQGEKQAVLSAAPGALHAIFDFLAESVFAGLPRDLLAAVHAAALPTRFDDALLGMLLGISTGSARELRKAMQHRALFIEPCEPAGHFRFHDAVRAFLLARSTPATRAQLGTMLIDHYETAGDLRMAIDAAFDAGPPDRAARVFNKHKGVILVVMGLDVAYARWLARLPADDLAQFPQLASQYGLVLVRGGGSPAVADRWLDYARGALDAQTNPDTVAELRWHFASAHLGRGETDLALAEVQRGSTLPIANPMLRAALFSELGSIHAMRGEMRAATAAFQQSQAAYVAVAGVNPRAARGIAVARNNQAALVDNVIGNFARAKAALDINVVEWAAAPSDCALAHLGLCAVHEGSGDWDALANCLGEIKRLNLFRAKEAGEVADPAAYVLAPKWEMFYWAAVHIGRGDYAPAKSMIDGFCDGVSDPEAVACGRWLRAWLLRAQGRWSECLALPSDRAQTDAPEARTYEAAIGAERAIAAHIGRQPGWLDVARPHIAFHMRLRARHYLLRWRVLFALTCHAGGDNLWRKHAAFVLQSLRTEGYSELFIRREPALAENFWALCVREGIALDAARMAFRALRRGAALRAMLNDAPPDAQIRLIGAISETGEETAIPLLVGFASAALVPEIQAACMRALDALEVSPPPTLSISLLGEFVVTRGGEPVDAGAWQRPGVRQLLQYMALHRGKPLSRAQVLRDLWPNNDPASAANAFRTAFSRLGAVLEPHLRDRAAVRYFTIDSQTICFDPQRCLVTLDTDAFDDAVVGALAMPDETLDDATLASLLAALDRWRAPLGEARYADWALAWIEAQTARYVDGCVRASTALRLRCRAQDAAIWAERATIAAPWQEAAWLALILATADQGHRALALRQAGQAATALQRELGAPPSPTLRAAMDRLRP